MCVYTSNMHYYTCITHHSLAWMHFKKIGCPPHNSPDTHRETDILQP